MEADKLGEAAMKEMGRERGSHPSRPLPGALQVHGEFVRILHMYVALDKRILKAG